MLLVEYILLANTPIDLTGDDNFKLFKDISVTTDYAPIVKVSSMSTQNILRWTIDKQVNLRFSSSDTCTDSLYETDKSAGFVAHGSTLGSSFYICANSTEDTSVSFVFQLAIELNAGQEATLSAG